MCIHLQTIPFDKSPVLFRGKSRSATIVLAYLMQKNSWSLERALKKVRARRECVAPHEGFLAQLKLYESMGHCIDGSNVQFKMFRDDVYRTSVLAALCMFYFSILRAIVLCANYTVD